ncbi:MAG TPA: GNAT family N-acetyltransferase [Pseudonocardiaceae bacterium]
MRITSGRQDPDAVRALLTALPDWFGIEAAIDSYVADARTMPTYLATGDDGTVGGVLLAHRHFPAAAEIHLLAVAPGLHRRGIGRALVGACEAGLRAGGVRFLQVKTLGESRPSEAYDRTRKFYLALGFTPLEEFADLWPGNPCLQLVKVL